MLSNEIWSSYAKITTMGCRPGHLHLVWSSHGRRRVDFDILRIPCPTLHNVCLEYAVLVYGFHDTKCMKTQNTYCLKYFALTFEHVGRWGVPHIPGLITTIKLLECIHRTIHIMNAIDYAMFCL